MTNKQLFTFLTMLLLPIVIFLFFHAALLAPLRPRKLSCKDLSATDLETILGPAFNPYFMSLEPPPEDAAPGGGKRAAAAADFYFEEGYSRLVADRPAWEVVNHVALARGQRRREEEDQEGQGRQQRGVDYMQQWQCRSQIKWIDLGPNYFPRYLRSVVCLSGKCWFGFYTCKPRAFPVKLLRRRNHCAKAEGRIGVGGLPSDLKQEWVWEERSVNFCCDCTRI